MMGSILLAIAAFTLTENIPPAVDPLIAQIETGDADRFAALFERTNGRPTAAQIQHEYLDQGSYGVEVFTPNRIRDASYLASRIAAKPELYAKAIRTCLPIAKQTTSELRATYLAFHGLLPERALPRIYLVVGADNSGGTAGPGAQVLGLETLCRISQTPEQLRTILRGFYAHETVHVFQSNDDEEKGNALLRDVLTEGAADFIAMLVTGRQMDPARAAWAEPREAELWEQFQADLKTTAGLQMNDMKPGTPAAESVHRWVANYGSAPAGWPGEAGYWLGQRIWERWYNRQADKAAAVRAMLELRDPEAVLAAGSFVSSKGVHYPAKPYSNVLTAGHPLSAIRT